MINLIYEKGEFRFEKAFESVTPQTMDVFLTVKDVVPDTQQPDLTQQACLFINKKLGTEYSTEGLGDFSKTEEKTIVSITEINFRLYQKVKAKTAKIIQTNPINRAHYLIYRTQMMFVLAWTISFLCNIVMIISMLIRMGKFLK